MITVVSEKERHYKRAIYLDLEWTCWNTTPPPGMKEEIIEIGVVAMDLARLQIIDEASYFVRPRRWEISKMCTKITGITDQDIRSAKPLVEVIPAVVKRFQPQGLPCYTWGEDVPILARACSAVSLANPFGKPIDLSRIFQGVFVTKEQIGLKSAAEMLITKFVGFAHGALPDAKNTALIHATILKRLRHAPDLDLLTSPKEDNVVALSPFAQKLRSSLKSSG